MKQLMQMLAMVIAAGLCLAGATASTGPSASDASDAPAPRRAGRRIPLSGDPFSKVSAGSLLSYLADLTAIRPHGGWRHSTSSGEAEAIVYAEERLAGFGFLRTLGLEVEREDFRTYLGIEFRETRVHLRTGGAEVEVPADAPAGHRERLNLALRFDSDGRLNDSQADPVVVEGPPLLVRSAADIHALSSAAVSGHVVFLDYAVIDRVLMPLDDAVGLAWELAALQPAGIVMVTSFSNRRGESHGTFAGDGPAFNWVEVDPMPPVLLVRLEDLGVAGVSRWNDLLDLESVRLTWDVDLFSPGDSALLTARIPGVDTSRAVILGAHIDSPNSPGALDNGSGSVALLEVARALNRARVRPPVDLYLVWFGSHERGVYGSAHFVTGHSELLDRSLAMLQMDCLSHPLDGIDNSITLESWPYGRFGDERTTWADYLDGVAQTHGVSTLPIAYYGLVSDNSNFNGFDVPNANLIYMDPFDIVEVHYDNHMHDPYDTVELAGQEGEVFEDMARVMLMAALETAEDAPQLRVTPEPDRRILFVGSHTEGVHMSPTSFVDFGMAMAWEGFDVDMVPYGRAVTAEDLRDTDIVVALPVHDYPSTDGDVNLYDEAWTTDEIDAIESYVRGGGFLVLTNSAHRLKYVNYVYESNEDWDDVNALSERFGVHYTIGGGGGSTATATGTHPLMSGVETLELAETNGVWFTASGAQELARVSVLPAVSLVVAGSGEVLVLADLGLLGSGTGEPANLVFWRNLADYARGR